MQVVVFGANGKVGSRVVAQLIKDGHTVRAFVRGTHSFTPGKELEVIQGDIRDQNQVASVIAGCDVVISALGSWGTKSKDILTVGMANIIPAMQTAGVSRIVSLTGADAWDATDKPAFTRRVSRSLLKWVAPKILHDGERHIFILRASDLDWTVVRSPVMKDGRAHGYTLRESPPRPWSTIAREDVAAALVDLIQAGSFSKSSPFIIGRKGGN